MNRINIFKSKSIEDLVSEELVIYKNKHYYLRTLPQPDDETCGACAFYYDNKMETTLTYDEKKMMCDKAEGHHCDILPDDNQPVYVFSKRKIGGEE